MVTRRGTDRASVGRRVGGRVVVAPDVGDPGAAVVGEYLRAHFRGRPYGDADWVK